MSFYPHWQRRRHRYYSGSPHQPPTRRVHGIQGAPWPSSLVAHLNGEPSEESADFPQHRGFAAVFADSDTVGPAVAALLPSVVFNASHFVPLCFLIFAKQTDEAVEEQTIR